MGRLPKQARHFRKADERYWRLWYERGFSPQFAWKNTDPRQPTISRDHFYRGKSQNPNSVTKWDIVMRKNFV
jgi:hypothetical protein